MNVFRKSVLAVGVSVALASLAIPSAHAVSINWGEIEGSFDSTFSVGHHGVLKNAILITKLVK